jgi:hypothetical protein
MARKQLTKEELDEFAHRVRQFYIRITEDALPLASLPEFKDAVALMKTYEAQPDVFNRKMLMTVYRRLKTGNKDNRRKYGYTAIGCFYEGLVHTLWASLFRPREVWSSDAAYYAEAFWCAQRDLKIPYASYHDKARKDASERHTAIYDELFAKEQSESKEAA